MAQVGGRREGAGRKPGIPNKTTKDIRDLAQVHGPSAVARLAYLMEHAESEQAQTAACKELLDRAYGKAKQPITGGDEGDAPINMSLKVRFVASVGT